MLTFLPTSGKRIKKSNRLKKIRTLQEANKLLQASPQIVAPANLTSLRKIAEKPKYNLTSDFDHENYVEIRT